MKTGSALSLIVLLALALSSGTPGLATSDYATGVALFRSGRYREASRAFSRVIMKDGKNTNAMYYAGLCFKKIGNEAQARYYFTSLIKDFPRSAAAVRARQALSMTGCGSSGVRQRTVRVRTRSSAPGRAAPRSAAGASSVDRETIPFRRQRSGHLVVDGQVNGHSQQFIFDTGAEDTVFSKKQLRALGIQPPTGKATGIARGAGGAVKQWRMPLDISLGRIHKRLNCIICEESGFLPLIGQTFFSDYHYNINNASGSILFNRRGSGSQEAMPVDTINVPFTNWQTEMVVELKVNGQPVKMIFDTGAQSTAFAARQVAPLLNGRGWTPMGYGKMNGIGGAKLSRRFKIDEIALGSIRKSGMVIDVMDMGAVPFGLLGQDFFGRRQFRIDYDRKLIRFMR